MKDNKKEDFLDDDFNEIDARLTAGWYVHNGQRKRYLKSLNQKKKLFLLGIVNIVIPATNLAKTAANASYSMIKYIHGIQGQRFKSP